MINIIPMPNSVKSINRSQQFKSDTSIFCNNNQLDLAKLLAKDLNYTIGEFNGAVVCCENIDMAMQENATGIFFVTNNIYKDQEYELKILAGRIIITASSNAGFYYACSSLQQLFPKPKFNDIVTLPQLTINDCPQYNWRGLLFDEARHFFGKQEVMRIIDIISKIKINKFHWHLVDDQGFRLQLDCYPELTQIGSTRPNTQVGGFYSAKYSGKPHGGYYTKSDIKEVIDYASIRGVEIIPGLNMPGHASAMIASLPILQSGAKSTGVATNFGNLDNIICAGEPKTYEILNNIINEVCQMFPSKHIHLGGNEVNFDVWDNCLKCKQYMASNNISDYRELLGHFFNKLNQTVKANNKTAVIFSSAYSENLDKDIILQYNSVNQLTETVNAYNNGRKIIISPPSVYYFDYPNAFLSTNKVYKHNMPPIEFQPATNNILGVECALWTEWVYDSEKIDVNLFPRIHAVAEKTWSKNFSAKNFKQFLTKLENQEDKMDRANICYFRRYKKKPMLLKRLEVRWQYLHKDQYREVKLNRKNKETI